MVCRIITANKGGAKSTRLHNLARDKREEIFAKRTNRQSLCETGNTGLSHVRPANQFDYENSISVYVLLFVFCFV